MGPNDDRNDGREPQAHAPTVACVRIPHFALRVAVLDHPELDGAPLVLGPRPGERPLVAGCTPEAARRGIRPGMTLREAAALAPEAVVIPPNPTRDAAVFDRLLDGLETFSPLVEAGASGCCYVDLRGLGRHHGLPSQAATRLLAAAPPILRPRAGVAPGKFAAWVAAGLAPPGTTRAVAPDDVVAFLVPVPVDRLPLPPDTLRRMERLGIGTLGELAALPAAAVAARFGPAGRDAWALASGRDAAAVRPRERATTITEELELPAPATSREVFLLALRRLVRRAFDRPSLRDRAVRTVRLRAQLEGGGSWETSATLREPSGATRLTEALRLRFGALELPGPVEAVTLELSGLTAGATAARQVGLAGFHPRRAAPLAEAARHLKQRYGVSPLYRIAEVEPWSRIPERRHALISYDP